MKKLFIICALVVGVLGCASIQDTEDTQNDAFSDSGQETQNIGQDSQKIEQMRRDFMNTQQHRMRMDMGMGRQMPR